MIPSILAAGRIDGIAVFAQSFEVADAQEPIVQMLGSAILAAGAAAAVAAVYRWYSREEVPDGVAVLVGLTVVALRLNAKSALEDAIIGDTDLLEPETAAFTIATFVVAGIAADLGRRLGDELFREVFVTATPRSVDEVTQLVRSAGRVMAVDLPETIEDVDGYDPVSETTKADIAGQTLIFPRRLTGEQLSERLAERLKRDYGVGHVEVALSDDWTVESLALGSRRAGIGPTLAPGSVAVAIRGDPAPDASPGDAVEVWEYDDEDDRTRRVTTAELRSTVGDVATVAVGAEDGDSLAADRSYRLVTLPTTPDVGRELVTVMRAADETVTTVSAADASLVGASVGSLPVPVLALSRDGEPVALPGDDVTLRDGDVAYVLGTPANLRRLGER